MMMRGFLTIVLVASGLMLASCNTIYGLGKDMRAAGEFMTDKTPVDTW